MVLRQIGGAPRAPARVDGVASADDFDAENLDVAVVGAGVSGVYSAWRLRL